MPWNEPGGDKDPWSGGPKKQGTPSLDEIIGKLSKKFSGKSGGSGGAGSGAPGAGAIWVAVGIAVVLWMLSGFYIVNEGTQGLVLRFGQYQKTTEPGLNWHLPSPVEKVEIVDVASIRSYKYQTTMLTRDENIVAISLAAQFRVKDAYNYIFNVRDPDITLQQAVESALRESVGENTMDFVILEGRTQISALSKELTQKTLDFYKSGIVVTSINLQDSQPPEPVQASFFDAIDAREDKDRYIKEAETYSNAIIPQARGEAARIEAEASAYKESVIARAEGDASRFVQLMKEYQKAPRVTRERLYLETIEGVLSNTSKVMMDSKNSNSMMYLPLDKLIRERSAVLDSSAPPVLNRSMLHEIESTPQQAIQPRIERGGRSREVLR